MNKNYETVIIFTPVLNDEEVKKQIKKYVDLIKDAGGSIVHEDHWGLRQLAYPIQKKTTGIYHIVEYDAPGEFVDIMELQFRRDENVIRFLTTALDKYALDYNERKRNGLIGKKKEPKVEEPVVPKVAPVAAAASTVVSPTETATIADPVTVLEPAIAAEPVVTQLKEDITQPTSAEIDPTPVVEQNTENKPATEETTITDTNRESEKTDEV